MFESKEKFPLIPVIITVAVFVGLLIATLAAATNHNTPPVPSNGGQPPQMRMMMTQQNNARPQSLLETQSPTQAMTQQTQTKQVALGPNEFRVNDIKVGDKVAGMKLTEIGPFKAPVSNPDPHVANDPFGDENFKATFVGNKTLSGTYHYYGDDEAFLADSVCFNPDEASLKSLPQVQGLPQDEFCFSNDVAAKNDLGPKGKSGKATIVIGDYQMLGYPIEASYSAKLVQVVKKG